MTRAGRFTIAPDHPALPGHFPGRPVVPAVVLLDHVAELLGRRPIALPAVKFTRPVRPGQEVELILASPSTTAERIQFTCEVDGHEVARGTLLLEPG